MRVGLCATAGHTEVGGLQAFLQALLPGATIQRLLPAVRKPAPKKGISIPVPRSDHSGMTGSWLVHATLQKLQDPRTGPLDALILADDADCRFDCEAGAAWERWTQQTTDAFRQAQSQLPVFLLLASPEIEAWFLADFDRGFGHDTFLRECFRNGAAARGAVRHRLTPLMRAGEAFGGPRRPDGCTRKLSVEIVSELDNLPGAFRPYSKRLHGGPMLRRLNPEIIRARCPLHAGPTLSALLDWHARFAMKP